MVSSGQVNSDLSSVKLNLTNYDKQKVFYNGVD